MSDLPVGLHFTCANGHPYARVREPIAVGELNWAQKLDPIGGPLPMGLVEPRCRECGARLMGLDGGFHTDQGLKP